MDFTPLVAALFIGRSERLHILIMYKWNTTNTSDEIQRMLSILIVIYQRIAKSLKTETRAIRYRTPAQVIRVIVVDIMVKLGNAI